MPKRATLILLVLLSASWLSACENDPKQGDSYYDRVIQPILTNNCASTTSGCHRADPGDPSAFASGNLDLTSFENVHKRPDVLRQYGPYPVPLLLLKAVGATDELQIAYRDEFLPVEMPHAAGTTLSIQSSAFLTLQSWLQNGATRDGRPPAQEVVRGEGGCSTAVPDEFDENQVLSSMAWAQAQGDFDAVQAVLGEKGCSAQNCHGAPQSDFYITCGDDMRQKLFNFRQVWAFVDTPVDDSEILRRPLAPSLGGVAHSGGTHFTSRTDADYEVIKAFAEKTGQLDFGEGDPGKEFFANNVMPTLLKRGCNFEGCHSPSATNDFNLRAGTQGFFSAVALEKNYETLKDAFMAFEFEDVRRSRAVAKNILPAYGGIAHRGGPLLETPGAGPSDPALCPQPFDPATASALCVFAEWSRIERQALGNPNADPTVPLVYVDRQASHVASPLEFATYQMGSDLMVADATLDATGAITGVGASRSLLDGCPDAANRAAVDVRAPDVRHDGTTVVFAMRTSGAGGLQLYTVNIDGTNCQRLTNDGAVNNFDPAWSPDGEWIVFASDRAGGTSRRLGLPQSDIWRMRRDGTSVEQVTFLSNSELSPQFMREGRIIMTTEKVDPADVQSGFYQLAGRRINWDLTDYHPLLAQRAMSPVNPADPGGEQRPSVGYQQATEIREAPNGNFLLVFSDAGARGGAGTLGIFNRSVGPMEMGRDDEGFLKSVVIPDAAATGRGMTEGAYRSPFMLPNGQILASYAAGTFDLDTVTSLDFDLVAVDPRSGQRTTILSAPGAQVEAVLALAYEPRGLYYNRRQLVFGGKQDPSDPSTAIVHFPDAPMVATLLGSNLRRGRFVDELRQADALVLYDGSMGRLGAAPLARDGSVRIQAPARTPVVIGLAAGGSNLFVMTEEHQFGPGEQISLGISESLFDAVCGGCHGSVSGREIDIHVTPDVLTGASQSLSANAAPVRISP